MSALLSSIVTNLPSPRGFYKWCRLLIIQHFIIITIIIIIIISALDAAAATTTVTTETKTMILGCFPIRFEVFATGRVSYGILTYVLRGTTERVVVVRKVHCCNIQFYGHPFLRNRSSRSTSCYLPIYSYNPSPVKFIHFVVRVNVEYFNLLIYYKVIFVDLRFTVFFIPVFQNFVAFYTG